MVEEDIVVEYVLVGGGPHIISSSPESRGWQTASAGYDFLGSYVLGYQTGASAHFRPKDTESAFDFPAPKFLAGV